MPSLVVILSGPMASATPQGGLCLMMAVGKTSPLILRSFQIAQPARMLTVALGMGQPHQASQDQLLALAPPEVSLGQPLALAPPEVSLGQPLALAPRQVGLGQPLALIHHQASPDQLLAQEAPQAQPLALGHMAQALALMVSAIQGGLLGTIAALTPLTLSPRQALNVMAQVSLALILTGILY